MNTININENKANNNKEEINIILKDDSKKLTLEIIKKIIDSIYSNKKEYNEIIKKEILINGFKDNIDNFICKFNINNRYDISTKSNKIIKFFCFFNRNLKYINKLFFADENHIDKYKIKKIEDFKLIKNTFAIYSILLLKKSINTENHFFIKKYLKIILLFRIFDKISLNICKLLLEIYINIIRDLFIIDENNIYFIDDLIESLVDFMNKFSNTDKNILYFIILMLKEYFFYNYQLKTKIHKFPIFLKLLKYKTAENKFEKDEIIINFLSNIYKYNISTNFLYKEIYKNGILDLNYYSNSLNLLSTIITEENIDSNNNSNFMIKKGFYIKNNNAIVLEAVELDEEEFSIIFSFKLLNDNKDDKDDIVIFNFSDYSSVKNQSLFLKFLLNKKDDKYYIKILNDTSEWTLDKFFILKGKDYFICITKSYTSDDKAKLVLYINDINSDSKKENKDKRYSKGNYTIPFLKFEHLFDYRKRDEMKLILGEKNFEGIIGDFFIIDKSLKQIMNSEDKKDNKYNDISNLLKLNGNYSYIAEYINVQTDLINNFDNFYLNNKDIFTYFKDLDFKCLLRILSDNINSNLLKGNEIYINNFGIVINKNEEKIEIFKLNNTLSTLISSDGIEFLVFQLHNLFSIFDKNNITEDELYIFNLYLYITLKLFYNILVIINRDGETNIKLKYSSKFDYLFFSFLAILDYYKKINKYLRMNLKIYNLLIEFVSFCEKDYYEERNLILSILLDDTLFTQQKVLREGKIFENLDLILQHYLDEDEDEQKNQKILFDNEILYKILNLQFILQSKEYEHRVYMKIILDLILAKNRKINKKIFKYILNLKNEDIIYHYLKNIFINFENLRNIIEERTINKIFCNSLENFSKNNIFFHCKYCFKISYIIPLIESELKIIIDKNNNDDDINIKEKKDIPINEIIKYKVCGIKTEFINGFNMNNTKKLNFVKIKESKFLNKEKDKDNKDKEINLKSQQNNKASPNFKNLDLIKNINPKKFFSRFNNIIKKINEIYEIFTKNISNIGDFQKELINSTFEIMKFFITEIIKNQKSEQKDKGKKIFIQLFNQRNELLDLFKVYFLYDFVNAINLLGELISISIVEISNPFYFDIYDSDLFSKKIKNEITKLFINKINIITKFEEIININREYLLIVIHENILKEKNIENDVEKFILIFIESLTIEKYYNHKYFYFMNGEYYNFFELIFDILFEFSKSNNYDKYIDMIFGFLISKENISKFYLTDMKILKDKKGKDIDNNTKEKDSKRIFIPNLLYSLYFLIYFRAMKNTNEINEQKTKKDDLVNKLIEVFFNNCFKILEYIKKKKLSKKYTLKINIPKLEIYTILFNTFISKDKKNFTREKFEQFFEDIYYKNKNKNQLESLIYNGKNNNSPLINEIKIESKTIMEGINNTENNLKSKEIQTNIISPEKINNNIIENDINISNFEKKKKFDLKSSLKRKNIPLIYYNKLINKKKDYLAKILSNPKAEFFWKTFTFSLKDMIFYNKNFIKLSKSFKTFSKDYILETSSPEEDTFYLNYPTKIKNLINNEYYRPFLKPDIKFFNRDIIKLSHNFISPKTFEKIRNKKDFTQIRFIKYIPINQAKQDSQELLCENISYRGSVLGKLYLKNSFLIFIDDYQNILEKSQQDPMFFVYSFQEIGKVKIKFKTIFMYYKDIQEIIIRRFFLKRLGYEIFLKDGHSYLFNFCNFDNFNRFTNIMAKKDITIITDPVKGFEKKDYKNKFKKGELSNFQYLLLLNKYATRTYNDLNQYLVFPLIFMDLQNNIKRDLSKAICLNKDEKNLEKSKYMENYEIQGYYFNNHYSTSAYVLYYLVRLIPYTYLQIEFQSAKFDVAERIFNNYNSYSSGILNSTENRELIPELFYNYELSLNLNHNNMGKMSFSKDLINNFNSNKYKTSIEFIINHRKFLDKENIVPWINNIFGYNQINTSKEIMNIFPLSSYEQFFEVNFKKIREKFKCKTDFDLYHQIRLKLSILDIGITPVQLFKSAHPEKNLSSNNTNDINNLSNRNIKSINDREPSIRTNTRRMTIDNNNRIKIEKKVKDNEKKVNEYFSLINNFISQHTAGKYKVYLDNKTNNIFFIFNNRIIIYNIINMTKGDEFPKVKYPIKLNLSNNLINLEQNFCDSSKNIISELMPGFYCICRNENRTLKFVNFTQNYDFSFLWTSVITAIEPYAYKMEIKFLESDYIWKIYFGDEEGFLCLIEFIYKYIFKNNEFKFIRIKILKKIKIHEKCVNNILYYERLNIIVSSSLNGDIAINNAYSSEIINMIKVGKNLLINNIKISSYDLLYIGGYNYKNQNYYVKCFTLNGLKVTKIKTKNKIINFFINDDYISLIYENKTVEKFCLYDFKSIIEDDEEGKIYKELEAYSSDKNISNKINNKIMHCIYYKKFKRMIIICNNNMELKKLI